MNTIIFNLTILLILSASLKGMNTTLTEEAPVEDNIKNLELSRQNINDEIFLSLLDEKGFSDPKNCPTCQRIEDSLEKANKALKSNPEEAEGSPWAVTEAEGSPWAITMGTLIDYAQRIGGETKTFIESIFLKFENVKSFLTKFANLETSSKHFPKTVSAILSVLAPKPVNKAEKYVNQLKNAEITSQSVTKLETGLNQESQALYDKIDSEIAARGGDVNAGEGNEGRTLLMSYASDGNLLAVKYLVEQKGADVNVEDTYYGQGKPGRTAIIFPAAFGHADVVEYLAEKSSPGTSTSEARRWANQYHQDAAKSARIMAALNLIDANSAAVIN